MPSHIHQRIRRDVVLRTLQVLRVEPLTPHMQRVVLGGPELAGFRSDSPDDHAKLFFPNSKGELILPSPGTDGLRFPPDREPSPMRDYTPRHYDAARGELWIDFVLHGDGPAANWAAQARPGQCIGAGGPRGSFVIADDFDHYVLAGDETALPAIGRWLEEAPAHARITALIEVPAAADRQPLDSRAQVDVVWLERHDAPAAQPGLLEHALRQFTAVGDCFYWIATESGRVRAIRQWLDDQGVPKEWIKSTGYWKAAAAG